jgi:iron complex outermembrane receptor protein
VLYSHRDYKAPFDRGTIFDLNTKHAVNVDRKTRFDEPFNITDGTGSGAAECRIPFQQRMDSEIRYSFSQDKYSDNQARGWLMILQAEI